MFGLFRKRDTGEGRDNNSIEARIKNLQDKMERLDAQERAVAIKTRPEIFIDDLVTPDCITTYRSERYRELERQLEMLYREKHGL